MNIEALVLAVLIFLGFSVVLGSLIKFLAFRTHVRDGDTYGNRLMGHGPDDELGPPPGAFRQLREWWRRRR